MFRHILVPIDLSDKNERVLRTALDLARHTRGRVTLLHVIQRVADIGLRELRGFYRQLERKSLKKLDQAARRFADQGVSVRTSVVIGEPAAEIVKTAARQKLDLIVMGSHKVGLATRVRGRGWGTTSYKVGIFCQCPVMLVK